MQITVITGSPHKKGTSALLADRFIAGAQEAGHQVFRFNAAFETVKPCLGCDHCRQGEGNPCVHQDGMEELNPSLLAADLVVLVTPLYYFGMSAQIKAVIDRFYAHNDQLMGSGKQAILLATSADDQDWTMQALVNHYQTILRYLQWSDAGTLLATGVATRQDIEATDYPQQAYELGRGLK